VRTDSSGSNFWAIAVKPKEIVCGLRTDTAWGNNFWAMTGKPKGIACGRLENCGDVAEQEDRR